MFNSVKLNEISFNSIPQSSAGEIEIVCSTLVFSSVLESAGIQDDTIFLCQADDLYFSSTIDELTDLSQVVANDLNFASSIENLSFNIPQVVEKPTSKTTYNAYVSPNDGTYDFKRIPISSLSFRKTVSNDSASAILYSFDSDTSLPFSEDLQGTLSRNHQRHFVTCTMQYNGFDIVSNITGDILLTIVKTSVYFDGSVSKENFFTGVVSNLFYDYGGKNSSATITVESRKLLDSFKTVELGKIQYVRKNQSNFTIRAKPSESLSVYDFPIIKGGYGGAILPDGVLLQPIQSIVYTIGNNLYSMELST